MIVEIIEKVRRKEKLTPLEIHTILNGYLEGEVKDYQMSAFLMAICCNGLSKDEIYSFVDCYIKSGKQLKFPYEKLLVDKHSTGGVGDKTTLIVAPIVASLGIPIVKMSGRGLGLTGGTIDKLESIPGYRINLTEDEILKQLEEIHIVITGATDEITPLDKKTYALRDVTGTVSSIPLIAISIMSKKIAGGAKKFVFDMKYGEGAFMKSKEEAESLANLMKEIASFYQCQVDFLYSDMSHPLGRAIGNRLEVLEAISVLKGESDGELLETSIELAAKMVALSKEISLEQAKEEVLKTLQSGRAYQKFQEWIAYQNGNLDAIEIQDKKIPYYAKRTGTIEKIHAKEIALAVKKLGALRDTLEDVVDPSSGIYLLKKENDFVKEGDLLAYLYTNKENVPSLDSCFVIKN